MKLITIRDIAIILLILIPSIILLMINFKDDGTYAEISYDGKVVKTVPLSEDAEFSIGKDNKKRRNDNLPSRKGFCKGSFRR